MIIFIFFLSCKENKNLIKNSEVLIDIGKKEMLNHNSLLLELRFNNSSDTNYILPISPNYILKNNKKIFNPVFGHIIASDFTDNIDYKMNFLLEDYTEKYFYNDFSHEEFKLAVQKDYEGYKNSLLFLPKKTKKKIFLIFNLYENCNDSPQNCNGIFFDNLSKVDLSIINNSYNFKILDSLLKKEKLTYTIYNKNLVLKDSLFINK